MNEELYRLPLYYDIAFSWDLTEEIQFFGRVFRAHVPFKVERILEPACGTGRFLVALPRHGYSVTGYDRNPDMLEFARKRLTSVGDPRVATTIEADMETARFERRFDAALNSINSLGYLHTDEAIVTHLRNIGESLRPGGVYVVHIACAGEGEREGPSGGTWEMERDGVTIRTTWDIEREDNDAKLSHQICEMEIDDHGEKRMLIDRHVLRLWFYDDIKELVRRSGALELAAVYGERFDPIPLDTEITGEMGNLYYILRAS
jgi:SAM-dependent methyltransferase